MSFRKSSMIRSKILALKSENMDPVDEPKEIEVSAQITVPPDGGWGWVVVMSSFFIVGITDGICSTFGSLYSVLVRDLKLPEALIPLINSVAVASNNCFGPIVSALINRYGFRFCVMAGSVTSSVCCLLTFLLGDYTALLFFYGFIAGFGYSLINMPAILVVGFYFQKWRAIAFTISVTGSSVGVIVFSVLYSHTVREIGWQYTILLQSGFLGLCFFMAMTFRPLLSMTVVKTITHDPIIKSLPVTPHLSKTDIKSKELVRVTTRQDSINFKKEKSRMLFNAESNIQFPTAAEVLHDVTEDVSQDISYDNLPPGPSSRAVSHLTLIPNNPDKRLHEVDLERVKSLVTHAITKASDNDEEEEPTHIDIVLADDIEEPEELNESKRGKSIIEGVFHWEHHVPESRPLYRDDVFLQKCVSFTDVDKEEKKDNAIDYQLKVSRVAAANDLKERRGVFTTAFRRVLATMLDPKYLKRRSFQRICFSMLLFYAGNMIPVVFVTNRGLDFGISIEYRQYFLSCIGFSGIFGRFIASFAATKMHPLKVVRAMYVFAGLLTISSCFGKTAELQIAYCLLFGISTAGTGTLRSLIIVALYGLENLTNCTGMVYLFQGFGCLISPPLAAALKKTGVEVPFIFAGLCFITSSLLLFPVAKLVVKENLEAENKTSQRTSLSKDDGKTVNDDTITKYDAKAFTVEKLNEVNKDDTVFKIDESNKINNKVEEYKPLKIDQPGDVDKYKVIDEVTNGSKVAMTDSYSQPENKMQISDNKTENIQKSEKTVLSSTNEKENSNQKESNDPAKVTDNVGNSNNASSYINANNKNNEDKSNRANKSER